ncbi:MAG TPA: DUF481 domain-containing protein [Saprospiraceae bacterium]|nr:DUF481 domain-containing protein [Saprospiraceae bacterium]
MKSLFFFIFYGMLSLSLSAQTVINTEEMRLRDNKKSLVGLFNFSFGMTQNKAGLYIKPNADVRLEWAQGQHRWITLGGYQLTRFSNLDVPGSLPRNFTHKGFGHLRYNRKTAGRVTWEAFTQYQFDQVQEIDHRFLLGTGPRWEIMKSDSVFIFAGVMYMYEYEQTSAEQILLNRHHRLSSYLTAGINFNENVGLNNTTYYQPRPDIWSDFRISTVTQLFARVSKQLSFTLNFSLVYDSRPPETVPPRMFDMTAGLSYQLK